MKIVMHCVYYPPEVGGLESHVHFLCRALVKAGHEVHVVTSRSMPDLPAHEVRDGVEVWRTFFPGKHTAGWLLHALGSVPKSRNLAKDADILHAQAFQSIPPLRAARARRSIPLVATWHTSHFLKLAPRPGWRSVLADLVRAPDVNLAASEEIALVAEGLAPGVSVEAVTNGVDTDFFRPVDATLPRPEQGRKRIVVPRRLFEKNGVEHFVRALPLLTERHDVEAILLGDGPERARLEGIASDLGVSDRIRFMGTQPHAAMAGLLCSAELAVFPSLMEATSVAALECMACEIPVAASRVGGLPQIVDHEVGGLFNPADPGDLANCVSVLLEKDDLRAIGATARRRVIDQWSNDRLARRHVEIYEGLVRRHVAS